MIPASLIKKVYKQVACGQLSEAIHLLEKKMSTLSMGPYHAIIGRNLLGMTEAMASYLEEFVAFAVKQIELKAIYLEMNGFTINTDLWFVDAFGFPNFPGTENFDWLADWETEDFRIFEIKGIEDMQQAYQDDPKYRGKPQTDEIKLAGDLTEYLVTLHLNQLVASASKMSRERTEMLHGIQILSTSHDFDEQCITVS